VASLTQSITRYWDSASDDFDGRIKEALAGDERRLWTEELTAALPDGNERRLDILDVGTGPGLFSVILSGLGHTVTGIDSSPDMVKRAQENADAHGVDARFLIGNASDPDFPEESLDVIVSRNLTWLLPDPESAYRRWLSLLRPGGRLIIFDGNWYGWMYDPELREKFRAQCEVAIERGWPRKIGEKAEEDERIARELPLTGVRRPEWDGPVLLDVGFRRIDIQNNTDDRHKSGLSAIRYSGFSTFAITADK